MTCQQLQRGLLVLIGRGDVGSLTRVGSMTIGYFLSRSERVFLWFW